MIRPIHGLVVAPCDGTISMIYPTKHALGIELENGVEILIHFGINTVKLNGQGFELLVKIYASSANIIVNNNIENKTCIGASTFLNFSSNLF